MPDFTDREAEELKDQGKDIATLKEWRSGMEKQFEKVVETLSENKAEVLDQQEKDKKEILIAIANGGSAASKTIADLPLKWIIPIVGSLIAVLGGSVASIADAVNKAP